MDMSTNDKHPVNRYDGDLEWKCTRCGLLLGIIDKSTQENVRIKVREQYYWIENADRVSTGCKRCGAFNFVGTKIET